MTRRITALGIAIALAVAALILGGATWLAWPLPADALARDARQSLTIEDRNGAPLRAARAADGSQTAWVPYEQIDPDLINAFVAVEDRRFWEHHGIDWRGAARAARDNVLHREIVSGASTITMQLARLARPADRDWGGKIVQTLWALRIERHLTKQQILEQYLNRVHLGQATVGVGAASALYFGVAPSALSIGQAATLAGLAHAPSRDNPHASPARSRARRAFALDRMRRMSYATREEVARARAEPLLAAPRTPPFLAPHFTTKVLGWAADDDMSGRVRTSLDLELQTALESEVRHTVDVLHGRGVEQAAAVVLDNASGEVLAWVGSPDFWAATDGQTDMVMSARQPGSALKPFLYALAIDRGFTAATVLPDIPKGYATPTGSYAPRNYDRRFRGPVRAREALASSYNVPAVELAARLGAGSLLHTLRLAGFASLDRDAEHYGLGLALGNGDVTLIELANGYRALANGGIWRPWTWRSALGIGAGAHGIDGSAGAESAESQRVVSPVTSAIVLDILRDPSARIPGFGTSTPFDFPFPVAVKTGTSRHFTDNWAVGTTQGFTVAVWAGNFSGRPMQGVSGVTGAGPLLHRAVMVVSRRVPPGSLATPAEAGAVGVPVCRLSGMLATPACAQLTEWFARGSAPTGADDWERDGHVALPDEYAEWARQGLQPALEGVTLAMASAGTQLVASPASAPDEARTRRAAVTSATEPRAARFAILSPLDGDRYAVPSGVEAQYATIALQARGTGAHAVRWMVDGKPFHSPRWTLSPGAHVFRAISQRGDTAEARIAVEQ